MATFGHVCYPCETCFVTETKQLAPCPFCGRKCDTGTLEDLRRAAINPRPDEPLTARRER